jgi:ribosomal protein S18 acetylase RimI-like enzyme
MRSLPNPRLLISKQYPVVMLADDQYAFVSSKERIETALLDDRCRGYQIQISDKTVGFILIKHYDSNKVFLWNMMVDIEYQKRGIGKTALNILLDELRSEGINLVTTTCSSQNGNARAFYEKSGFTHFETIVRENVDEMNLVLYLNGKST